jgi:K+-sensing histidine kinase KdpD
MRGWQSPAIDALALLIAVLAVSLASTATRCAWQAASAIAEAEAARPIAEADRARTTLLAAVSHDVRTPRT